MKTPYVIAEVGFNHGGSVPLAERMVREAAEAGADCVKFQTYQAHHLARPDSPHFAAVKSGELDLEAHQRLAGVATEAGIDFLSTPFSGWAVDLLEKVGVKAYKVASMDCTNHHLLGLIAQTGKPIYLSTGMATPAEIADALELLAARDSGSVTLLHCMSLYPAGAGDLNLSAIPRLQELFGLPVGYSDHFPGTKACLAAAMLGAEVIETHFTYDRTLPDGDHGHSADLELLRELIGELRVFRGMVGRPEALYARPDRECAGPFRRGIYLARDLKAGARIEEEDLLMVRPAAPLGPNDLDRILGMRMRQDQTAMTALDPSALEG